MNKKLLTGVLALTAILLNTMFTFAQGGDEAFRVRLESIFSKFKNYRFSEIAIYKVKDMKDIRNAIKTKEDDLGTTDVTGEIDDCIKKGEKNVLQFVENQTKDGKSLNEVRREMLGRGMSIPPDLDCIYNYYAKKTQIQTKQLRSAYAIVTRMAPEQMIPSTIIALIVSTEDNEVIEKNLDNPSPGNVYTYPELMNFSLDQNQFRSKNLYELVTIAFQQGNVENKTLEAQGIGGFMKFGPKRFGVSNSLVSNRYEITPKDIQKFLRVSDGQPNNMNSVKNELIVSADLIRWSQYDYEITKYEDGISDTLSSITNDNLPKYGFELRYGIEDINIPSLWSERMSLNALWQGTRLGLILPTNGWAGLSKDLMDVNRKLTYGGVGINGSIDFPILLIPASGIFHISGAYIFSDAKAANYKKRDYVDDPRNYVYKPGDDDYFIRSNATVFYTFGINVDEDYMLRFGLGGSIYSAEKWNYRKEEDPDTRETVLKFKKAATETVGGISGRLDFMAKGLSTPIGGTIQYFDEGLYANFWLQIPLVENRMHLRLDAKGYYKAFTQVPRAWENESVFIPMARIIINF